MASLSPPSTSRAPGPYLTTPEPLDKPSSPTTPLRPSSTTQKASQSPSSRHTCHPHHHYHLHHLLHLLVLTSSSHLSSHLFFHLTSFFICRRCSSYHFTSTIRPPNSPSSFPPFLPRPPPPSLCHAIISFFFLSLHSAVFFLLSFCLP